jgi:AbrB family looped-hinge helix DNA binding protein
METTLDKFGRIVIPKEIRDDFNLIPGSQIRIEESDQAIILKPIGGEPNLHWKDGVLVFSGVPMGGLDKALEKHREERTKTLGLK